MGKLFCLMGKSASGKDTFYSRLSADNDLGLKNTIIYTTRPKRSHEEDGREYYFVGDDTYNDLLKAGRIIESRTYQTVFGPWHYFTADDGQIDLSEGSYIVIGTLESYIKLKDHFGDEAVVPLLINVEALIRERAQDEPRYAEMCRRFLADAEDFSDENIHKAGITKIFDNINEDECYEKLVREIQNDI